jgi:D-sedoheptulose 7-phosphate isomerase
VSTSLSIKDYYRNVVRSLLKLSVSPEVAAAKKILIDAYKAKPKRKVFLIGNGGSWSTASHIANDLSSAHFAAFALDSLPLVSALANDYGYEHIFALQLERLANPDDVLIAISVSGKSKNIINAIKYAQSIRMKLIIMTGAPIDSLDHSLMESDCYIYLSDRDCLTAEPLHLAVLHEIAYDVERIINDG